MEFTRSRPYHSDDNAHVEQKNWTWARQLLGYGRLERAGVGGADQRALPGSVGALAELFSALLETAKKWREGSHWRKRYELPQTAYERLCAPGILPRKARWQLRERYASLNPFDLKDELEKKLKADLAPQTKVSAPPKKTACRFRPQGGASRRLESSPPCSFNLLLYIIYSLSSG